MSPHSVPHANNTRDLTVGIVTADALMYITKSPHHGAVAYAQLSTSVPQSRKKKRRYLKPFTCHDFLYSSDQHLARQWKAQYIHVHVLSPEPLLDQSYTSNLPRTYPQIAHIYEASLAQFTQYTQYI